MFKGIKYDNASGEIVGIVSAALASDVAAQADAHHSILPDNGDSTEGKWVDAGILKAREVVSDALHVVDVGGTVTLSLPNPCFVRVSTDPSLLRKVEGGSLPITSNEAGSVFVNLVGRHSGLIIVRFDVLASAKTEAKVQIDSDAEAARSRVVTPGSGQAMTYLRKADAARLFLSGGTLSAAQQQRLDDEAARLSVTVQQAATSIVALADQWELIDAQIDTVRLITKKAIDAATTAAQVADLVKTAAWPV